jgi:hypothetical protein
MHPRVRRDLALLGQLDHVNRRRVSRRGSIPDLRFGRPPPVGVVTVKQAFLHWGVISDQYCSLDVDNES